jgi:hypothetical protein
MDLIAGGGVGKMLRDVVLQAGAECGVVLRQQPQDLQVFRLLLQKFLEHGETRQIFLASEVRHSQPEPDFGFAGAQFLRLFQLAPGTFELICTVEIDTQEQPADPLIRLQFQRFFEGGDGLLKLILQMANQTEPLEVGRIRTECQSLLVLPLGRCQISGQLSLAGRRQMRIRRLPAQDCRKQKKYNPDQYTNLSPNWICRARFCVPRT